MNRSSLSAPRRMAVYVGVVACLGACVICELARPATVDAQAMPHDAGSFVRGALDWQEPRGIHVVDLVGLVPEEHLRGAVLSFNYNGHVEYISGKRDGDKVTVNVRIVARHANFEDGPATLFTCIGQYGVYDQWPAPVGRSTMRLFADGSEITGSILTTLEFPARQEYPIRSTEGIRYPEIFWHAASFTASGAVDVPAHTGCFFFMQGHHHNLTAEYVFHSNPSAIAVEPLGSEKFWFHSYIGPGEAGHVNSLRSQMQARYGNRHDKFRLNPPAGADYVLVKYPPTPVSPYAGYDVETNVRTSSSGTYRLSSGVSNMSNDHTVSMALPLYLQWKDADLAGGGEFRPQIDGVNTLTAPEYFVPVGIDYDSCMTQGGCSRVLLDAIHETVTPVEIFYYAVTRITGGLDRIPLAAVGSGYHLTNAQQLGSLAAAPSDFAPAHAAIDETIASRMLGSVTKPAEAAARPYVLYLPLLASPPPARPIEPDDPDGCPCGWFDSFGRMFDAIPGP